MRLPAGAPPAPDDNGIAACVFCLSFVLTLLTLGEACLGGATRTLFLVVDAIGLDCLSANIDFHCAWYGFDSTGRLRYGAAIHGLSEALSNTDAFSRLVPPAADRGGGGAQCLS